MMPFHTNGLPFEPSLWMAARLLPLYAVRRPLSDLLRRAAPEPGMHPFAGKDSVEILAAVKRSVNRPKLMRGQRCLREGLLAFHFLSLAGYSPVLHFGMVAETARNPKPRAHCWLSLEGKTVLNPPNEPMLDLFTFDGSNMTPNTKVNRGLAFSHV
jgi:hypothetical protein